MQSTLNQIMKDARTWAVVLALATTAASAAADKTTTGTPEENAKRLVKAMSDYLAAQKAIGFDYDTVLEVVTKENQKLG